MELKFVAEPRRSSAIQIGLLYFFSGVTAIWCLATLLYFSTFGFDFTDEGYYLNSLSDPWAYSYSVSSFGYVYHVAFDLLDGNVAALRKFNVTLTFFLAVIMCNLVITTFSRTSRTFSFSTLAVSTSLASPVLLEFDLQLYSPNYNSLTIQACTIVVCGLLLLRRNDENKKTIGAVIIGVGGWLAFMAKPTSAATLAILSLAYIGFTHLRCYWHIGLAIFSATCLVICSTLVIDGSVTAFLSRLLIGLELANTLTGRSGLESLFEADYFAIDRRFKLNFVICLLITAVVGYLWKSCAVKFHSRGCMLAVIILYALAGILASADVLGYVFRSSEFSVLTFLSIPLGILLAEPKVFYGNRFLSSNRNDLALALLLMMMPLCYGFGTSNNIWTHSASANVFPFIAAIVLLFSVQGNVKKTLICIVPFACLAQLATIAIVFEGMDRPYRQPWPLGHDSTLSVFPTNGSSLSLHQSYSRYISDAWSVSSGSGLLPDTEVIDLTGQSPGLLFALGVKSLGQPWLIGGYVGSLAWAEKSLASISCDRLSRAWLLYEPVGPRSISAELLSSFGADFAEDYAVAGSWMTAAGAGGFEAPRVQELYYPSQQLKIQRKCSDNRALVSLSAIY